MKKYRILLTASTIISISAIIVIINIDRPDSNEDIQVIVDEKNKDKDKNQNRITKMHEIIKHVQDGQGEKVFVTRKNIYHIKNGKIVWTGKLLTKPLFRNDKYYIATGKHIFCTHRNGNLKWKKIIPNDGMIDIRGNMLIIKNIQNEKRIHLASGDDVRR